MKVAHAKRILVIEDDVDIRDSFEAVLSLYGYQVHCSGNGQEALSYLASTTELPCLILLDLMMPVMNGSEFRRKQLADPILSNVPTVIISANMDRVIDTDIRSGAKFLRKPVELVDLLQVVEDYCEPRAS